MLEDMDDTSSRPAPAAEKSQAKAKPADAGQHKPDADTHTKRGGEAEKGRRNNVSVRGRGGRQAKHGGFDKTSGTGRDKHVAKDGKGGKYTWGSDADAQAGAADGEAAAAAPAGESAEAEAKEEEKPVLDFQQYLALKSKSSDSVNQGRAPANTAVAPAEEAKPQSKVQKKKQVLSLDEFVGGMPIPQREERQERSDGADRRPSSSRGGRGGARGGRGGQGGARFNLNDESAFPKLGGN